MLTLRARPDRSFKKFCSFLILALTSIFFVIVNLLFWICAVEARNEFPNDIRVTTKICAGANQSPCRFVSMKTRVDACDYIAGGQYYGAECPAAASQYTASGSITVPYGTEERFEETGYEYDRYYLKFEFRPSGNDSGGTYCQVPLHVYVADGSYRFWSYSSLGAVVALVGLATYGAKKRKLSTASDIPIDREEAIETEFVGSSL